MKKLLPIVALLLPLMGAQFSGPFFGPVVGAPASGTTAATPTFSPSSGAVPQTVTISTATPLAVLCYTTDGSTPTEVANLCSGGTTMTYSSPITVSIASTVKAIATLATYTDSAVGSATYTSGGSGPSYGGHECDGQDITGSSGGIGPGPVACGSSITISGNVMLLAIRQEGNGSNVPVPTFSGIPTPTFIESCATPQAGTNAIEALYYVPNITPGTYTPSVTWSFSTNPARTIQALDIVSTNPTSPIDAYNCASVGGGVNPADSGPVTTTGANRLFVGFATAYCCTNTLSAGTNLAFTFINSPSITSPANAAGAEYVALPTAGTYDAQFTTVFTVWTAFGVAIK